jgi:hypothetical protein
VRVSLLSFHLSSFNLTSSTTNPHNPIPIYDINTSFPEPTVEVDTKGVGKRCTVISIDHLPTLVCRPLKSHIGVIANNSYPEKLLSNSPKTSYLPYCNSQRGPPHQSGLTPKSSLSKRWKRLGFTMKRTRLRSYIYIHILHANTKSLVVIVIFRLGGYRQPMLCEG